jgi:flotillin
MFLTRLGFNSKTVITGDITQMAAQIPALFETLSGMKISDLLSKVRCLGDKNPKEPAQQEPGSKNG